MGARVTPDTVPGSDPTLLGGIRGTRYERFHADADDVPAARADAGSRAGPARRTDSRVLANVVTHAGEDAADHGEQGARREAVTATASRLLAGNGGRPAAAGDRADGAQRALEHEPASRPASAVAPASTAVLAAERVTVVAAAMANLPEQQRVTLALAAAGELNSAEIGAALGVPAGTVRYRLALARRTLAEALADYDDPQEEQ
jgi:DNA-directed RNA polymerase specialized sigma24 family protein